MRALQVRTWQALALAPVHDWRHAWHLVAAGRVVTAFVLCAPVAVPAGLFAAAGLWAWRIYAVTTGLAGHTASAPVWFDERQWRHQVWSARGRAAAPGTVPLLTGRGRYIDDLGVRPGTLQTAILRSPSGRTTPSSISTSRRGMPSFS